jgi:molecular chaperone DnaK
MKEVEEKKVDVSEEEKNKVNEALKALKEVKDKDDVEAIKKASEELSKVAQAVGTKMYEAAKNSADAKAADNADKDKKEQGPIEGEVVDENK